MFLRLPRTRWNDKKEAYQDEPLLINCFNVVAIAVDEQDPKCCLLIMAGGYEYYIKYTPQTLRRKIDEFVKENVLQKIYNQMKDQNN